MGEPERLGPVPGLARLERAGRELGQELAAAAHRELLFLALA